jgi:hypothetical protein
MAAPSSRERRLLISIWPMTWAADDPLPVSLTNLRKILQFQGTLTAVAGCGSLSRIIEQLWYLQRKSFLKGMEKSWAIAARVLSHGSAECC